MLRLRRYRVFLIFAVLTVFAFYKFSGSTSWQPTSAFDTSPNAEHSEHSDHADHAAHADHIANPAKDNKQPQGDLKHEVAKETKKLDVQVPLAEASHAVITPPPLPPAIKPTQKLPPPPLTSERPTKISGSEEDLKTIPEIPLEVHEHGQGRVEIEPLPHSVEAIHWEPQTEHFPIPAGSTIQLPQGSPKPIPKIQFDFKKETPEQKSDRESKLATIKEHFVHAWNGYKEKAWLHDELSPVSGKFRDPFAGWGATLVDALDTIWIMGLTEEFEEAVEGVKKIDFTTTDRADIPLFETTIRYLGGLLAAYDISGKKYSTLLDKAVELGDILIGAFDTPNRMPMTYYMWRPSFASQPHRATARVVLAEIGSLSMEFTRLAQLTKEPRYYDAVARITDLFEEWQNSTRLPGMWPTYLDASGCKKPEYKPFSASQANGPSQPVLNEYGVANGPPVRNPGQTKPAEQKMSPLQMGKPDIDETGHLRFPKIDETSEDAPNLVPLQKPEPIEFNREPSEAKIQRRQLEGDVMTSDNALNPAAVNKPKKPAGEADCDYPGFFSTSEFGSETFSLGGMADSTYEYLPKEWLLLGGLVDKYRTMYEHSADTAIKYLVYRPMVPGDEDILFAGQLNMGAELTSARVDYENAHLTCFAGGMFAMGAKIFDRKEDLEIGRKLTEGCVWSYKVTGSGIMPESFNAVPCPSISKCAWNETAWWEKLDPWAENRQQTYEDQMQVYVSQVREAMAEASLKAQREEEAAAAAASNALNVAAPVAAVPTPNPDVETVPRPLHRRQLEDAGAKPTLTPSPTTPEISKNAISEEDILSFAKDFKIPSNIYKPIKPQSHKEKVLQRIEQERLPKGVVNIGSRKYILRPEAIESVFYMYRITGEQRWRDAGWRMFQAVAQHTRSVFGHSALDDITKENPEQLDEMESFWLAETLKYFYLLFATEDVVSLDDWVLNTEAHPFRRPKKAVGE